MTTDRTPPTAPRRRSADVGSQAAQGRGSSRRSLVGATLVGIVALLVLFGYIAFDAFRPLTASTRWYLLYFGTLVTPTAAFTWYARRHPAVRAVNAKSFAVVFGVLAVSLVVYVVADAVSPYDVLIYLVFGTVPPILVYAYARLTGERTYSGPAIPISIIVGLAVAAGLYGVLRPLVGLLAQWIAYVGIVTLPVAGMLGVAVMRRLSARSGVYAAATVLGTTLVLVVRCRSDRAMTPRFGSCCSRRSWFRSGTSSGRRFEPTRPAGSAFLARSSSSAAQYWVRASSGTSEFRVWRGI
ncbi:MAG: hypothetical protein U5K70_02325 [Halodesulfurarchaeum sp.]|nr:hypothetical protein [Halodesulfurarchaeum sp.]